MCSVRVLVVESAKAPLAPVSFPSIVVAVRHESRKIPNPGVVCLLVLLGPVEKVDGFRIMFSRHVNGAVVQPILVIEGVHIDVHVYHFLYVVDLVRRYWVLYVVDIVIILLKIVIVCNRSF